LYFHDNNHLAYNVADWSFGQYSFGSCWFDFLHFIS
jgi:hypothetical protein